MQAIVLLRFDAPLMSFGGVRVDEINVTDEFPAQSMITGLCANALGLTHRDAAALKTLEGDLVHASRIDRRGSKLVDYQTVDLGQEFMRAGWTTWGREEGRSGSPTARTGTHQRWRHFWADRVVTVALTLKPTTTVALDELRQALCHPARPIFLGRKCCVPSTPVFLESAKAENVLVALEQTKLSERAQLTNIMLARWPAELGERPRCRLRRITDERDWGNQVHVGRRRVYEGNIEVINREGASA